MIFIQKILPSYYIRFHLKLIVRTRKMELGLDFRNSVDQLCPTQMAYWANNYVTILTRAAHWMAYFELNKANLA